VLGWLDEDWPDWRGFAQSAVSLENRKALDNVAIKKHFEYRRPV
jgi:hypothetical protein